MPLNTKFGQYIGFTMTDFVVIMLLLFTYLNNQSFFNDSVFLKRLFILSFGFGEIGIMLAGAIFALKHGIIVIKREKPQK